MMQRILLALFSCLLLGPKPTSSKEPTSVGLLKRTFAYERLWKKSVNGQHPL